MEIKASTIKETKFQEIVSKISLHDFFPFTSIIVHKKENSSLWAKKLYQNFFFFKIKMIINNNAIIMVAL